MLDTIEPKQFDEWVAFRKLEHDPYDRIATILKRGFTLLCAAWGEKDLDMDAMEPGRNEADDGRLSVTQDEAVASIKGAYGL